MNSRLHFKALCVLFAFLVNNGISSTNSHFPFKFDKNCFVHIAFHEPDYFVQDFESQFLIQRKNTLVSDKHQLTWTIHHDLSKLHMSVSKAELLENEKAAFNISEHYFRFHHKYQTEDCKVVVIIAESFNATLFAVNAVGYGTSDRVLHLVGVIGLDPSIGEILQGFSQDLYDQHLDAVPFHAPLAFFTTRTQVLHEKFHTENDGNKNNNYASMFVYCYSCPSVSIGKFHSINAENTENEIPSVSQVKDYWGRWNMQGYGNKIILHSPGDWEYKDTSRIQCTREDRLLYNYLNRCHYAEMLMYNNLDNVLNMTYSVYRHLFNDPGIDTDDWYLNINADEWSLGKVVVNVYVATRGTYQLFQDIGYKFIYCNPGSKITYLAWDIFLHVFDLHTWLGFLGVLSLYAILRRNVLYGLDLVWPFLGMDTWKSHPRVFMGFYLLCIGIFLQLTYGSGTSSDFIQFKTPMSAPTLFRKGYKTWLPNVAYSPTYMGMIHDKAPLFLQKKLYEIIGGKRFEDILYRPVNKNYSIPSKPLEMIKDMVQRQLLVISVGLPRYNPLMQVFTVADWALIADKGEKYLCAGVGVPSHIEVPKRRHASRTWGFLSGRAARIVSHWFEMGFVGRMQVLLNHKLTLKKPINWVDPGNVSEQNPVSIHSPLGITTAGLVIFNLLNLIVFVGYKVYLWRSEVRSRDFLRAPDFQTEVVFLSFR